MNGDVEMRYDYVRKESTAHTTAHPTLAGSSGPGGVIEVALVDRV